MNGPQPPFWLLGIILLATGLVTFVALACEASDALDELDLIRSGAPTDGVVTNSWGTKDPGGESLPRWSIDYTYRVDGKTFSGRHSEEGDWHVPDEYRAAGAPVSLEYARRDPSISRPRGTGEDTVASWLMVRASALVFIGFVGAVFTVAGVFLCFLSFPLRRPVEPRLFVERARDLRPVEWTAPDEWIVTADRRRAPAGGGPVDAEEPDDGSD